MKAKEWRIRFDACKTLDQILIAIGEFIQETVDLANKRRNYSAVLEQKQKWKAIKLLPDEVFDICLDYECPALSKKTYEDHSKSLFPYLEKYVENSKTAS